MILAEATYCGGVNPPGCVIFLKKCSSAELACENLDGSIDQEFDQEVYSVGAEEKSPKRLRSLAKREGKYMECGDCTGQG